MSRYYREDFKEYISELSDKDLVLYIHATEGTYRPEAVAFARKVLESRRLSPQVLASLEELAKAQINREQIEQSLRAGASIAWYWKPWIVLCGLYILFLVPAYVLIGTAVRFSMSGERKKARQLWVYGIIGLGLLVVGVYFLSGTRGEMLVWIIVPVVPSIFLGWRLRHFIGLPREVLPQLSDMEFRRMKSTSGAAFGILGFSILLVPITSVLWYKLTTQSSIFIPLIIAAVGLCIAALLDLKAEEIKKQGKLPNT
jgi:hypothetical protein